MAGAAFGAVSPAPALSPTLYLDMELQAHASLVIPAAYAERALYALDAGCTLDGEALPQYQMRVLSRSSTPVLHARESARVILIGGEPLGPRHIAWNFVSSRKERLLQARDDWMARRFPAVPGETEFIPYPSAKN